MPLTYEREDGYDTVEWAAKLPGSNGRVGMYGASYFGNTQWMAAIEQPPSLAAIVPAMTWSDPLEGLFGRGGAVELGVTPHWSLLMGAAHLLRLPLSEEERGERLQSLIDDIDNMASDGYWGLPVHDLAVLQRHDAPELGTLRTLGDPSVAARSTVAGHYERVGVPTFHIGGWYDIFTQGVLDGYAAMSALGRSARLIVGPWTHFSPFSDPIGELCFGVRCDRFAPVYGEGDLRDAQLSWLREQLLPGAEAEAEQAPVRIFVMGRNVWRDEASWPLARARTERWFLGAGGDLSQQSPDADAAPSETAGRRAPRPRPRSPRPGRTARCGPSRSRSRAPSRPGPRRPGGAAARPPCRRTPGSASAAAPAAHRTTPSRAPPRAAGACSSRPASGPGWQPARRTWPPPRGAAGSGTGRRPCPRSPRRPRPRAG